MLCAAKCRVSLFHQQVQPEHRLRHAEAAVVGDVLKAGPIGRRDFLYVATGAAGSLGALAATWPFIRQMSPSAGVLAAGAPVTVDLSPMEAGQQTVVLWRSMPIFVVRRTQPVLEELKANALLGELRDPHSAEMQQPAYARNWSRSLNPEYLVVVGICTHLGCIPSFSPERGSVLPTMPGGYLCHCHGSRYDLAGRVYKGVPAPFNLPVPPHHFPGPQTLVIGENPQGESFDLSQVEQL
jgi:ubiquinol-cytochrome c reductase iron-sulfur subunit